MKFPTTMACASAVAMLLTSCGEQQEQPKPVPQRVSVTEVAVGNYATAATLSGEVKARVSSELSFRVAGRITERTVDVGDRVRAGEVLAKIDPQEQNADVAVATAGVQAAEAQHKQASLTLERQKSLLANMVTTQANYDNAEEAYRTATAALDMARNQLATALDALSYTELRAEADGVITARSIEVGQVAQATQSIFTLAHDGPRDAVFDVFEGLFLRNEGRDKIKVTLLSDPTREIVAPIKEISPTINNTTGTIRVKVDLGNSGDRMPLGAAVSGVFAYKSRELIVLPWGAMASLGGKPAVWLVDPARQAVSLRKVEVGDYETQQFTVVSGLKPKDLVVTDGGKMLAPDQTVAIIGRDAP